MTTIALETAPLSGGIGVEVRGVDVSSPLTPAQADAVKQAFTAHACLLFRDQDISPASQVAFTRWFGEPLPHPLKTRPSVDGYPEVLILQNQPGKPGARNDYWHSDISHAQAPPSASILHARHVPDGRGDTMICNMYAAWEQLSAGMRRMLVSMRAEHSAEATLARNNLEHNDGLPINELPAPSLHPVARTHPDSGRIALYVNPHFTVRFEDMTRDESRALLRFLNAHATRPENVYRHRWRAGDLLMWDNRCTMHYAVRDYDDSMPRLMHRTTAAGEVPT